MPLPLLALAPIALSLAKEFVPDLVSAVAGDAGGQVAKQVIDTVSTVTGVDIPTDDPAAAEAGAAAAIALARKDPELAAKVRVRLAEIELEHERMYLDDRADARARDVALAEAGDMNWRGDIMVLVGFLGVIGCILALALYAADMPEAAVGAVTLALGSLLKMLGDAFAFEFGSSRGSKNKDGALAAVADAARRRG